ncbi:MAG TPA: hypothetical protein VFG23_18130, partial [Polyangia bacterium]|nr:hypothetical protein [Polyangia bacterium]
MPLGLAELSAVAAPDSLRETREPPPAALPPTLAISGECPAAASIWADVEAIVPTDNLSRVTSATIEVTDLGDSYRVHIVGQGVERARVFRDLERDCDHRARFVAVFVVLTLLPPDFVVEAKPDPPPPPPKAEPPKT